jgi:hypothetical protein
MREALLLVLLCAACADPPALRATAHHAVAAKTQCVIPAPPSADDLAAAQAAHGLVGRDALLTAYAKRAFAAKQACH